MEKLKKFYIFSLLLLGAFLFFIYSQILSTTSGETLSLESKQQLVEIGEKIDVHFSIYNTGKDDRNYTFAIFFNDKRMLNDTVLVKAGDSSKFGGHFLAKEPGKVKVTAELYDADKKKLLDSVTYYVTVKPKS
ncbi:MAG: hypothetical protein ACE5NL_02415 [Candidatus Hydrothermarchaeaceae archaeon]